MSLSARMLAVAARSRQEAKELREAAKQEAADLIARAEEMAQQLEESAARLESQAGERIDLDISHEPSTIGEVNASPSTAALKSQAILTDEAKKHPFVAQVLVGRNKDVGEIAAWLSTELKRKVSRSTVQAWYKDPSAPAFRRIPDDAERALRKRFGLARSSWPHVQPPKTRG